MEVSWAPVSTSAEWRNAGTVGTGSPGRYEWSKPIRTCSVGPKRTKSAGKSANPHSTVGNGHDELRRNPTKVLTYRRLLRGPGTDPAQIVEPQLRGRPRSPRTPRSVARRARPPTSPCVRAPGRSACARTPRSPSQSQPWSSHVVPTQWLCRTRPTEHTRLPARATEAKSAPPPGRCKASLHRSGLHTQVESAEGNACLAGPGGAAHRQTDVHRQIAR